MQPLGGGGCSRFLTAGTRVRQSVHAAAGSARAQPSGWRSGPKATHPTDSFKCLLYWNLKRLYRLHITHTAYRAVQPRRTAAWLFVGAELLISAVQGAAPSQCSTVLHARSLEAIKRKAW